MNGLFVELLQDLVVLHLSVHLNFEGVDLQKLSTLLLVLFAIVVLKIKNELLNKATGLPCTTPSAV